jgi:hypothetical protein
MISFVSKVQTDFDCRKCFQIRQATDLGCQMVYFRTKNTNLGKLWMELCRYILWPFGLFYGHLVYFMAIWSILWPSGIYYGFLVLLM